MSTMPDHLAGEELVASLKQLVISFCPYIKESGSVEQAEDSIVHMEENNENFHRYEFVKRLRTKIEGDLGKLIDAEIADHSISPSEISTGQELAINKIIDKVIKSNEYNDLRQSLKENVVEACDTLLRNFEQEFASVSSNKGTSGHSLHQKMDIVFHSDEEWSLGDSSLNQSAFMFMNTDQYKLIADSLDKKKPNDKRREAMKSLQQIAATDVQNCEVWLLIKQHLQDALVDPDQELWTQSLRFLAKGLSTNNSCTKEIYTTLVEFLTMQFQSVNKANIPKVSDGLDTTTLDHEKLLKAFRLMNEFQHHIPQFWVRYPERFLDEILESTMTLLGAHQSPSVNASPHMTPVHFLALIDPIASWFTKWMHGHYSRAPLLKVLSRHRIIVDSAVRTCLDYTGMRKIPFTMLSEVAEVNTSGSTGGSTKNRSTYVGHELEYINFIHSLYMVGRLLMHKHGREFFPIKMKDREEPVTVLKLLVHLIELITQPTSPIQTHYPIGLYDPAMMSYGVLKKLCNAESVCAICICKDEVTDALLVPISYWLHGTKDVTAASETTMLLVADLLSVIVSSSRGRHHLLYGETQECFTKAKSSAAHILAEFTQRAMAEKLSYGPPPPKTVIGQILFVCRQLYTTCDGLLAMYPYDMHNTIALAWRIANREADKALTPTPSMNDKEKALADRESQYILIWEDTLLDNLLNFAGTPKGLLLLQQTGAISECVQYMQYRYAKKMQVSKCEKFGYGYMLSQVAATAPGIVALQNTGFISDLIKKLWGELEIADDHTVYTPKYWPIHPIDKAAKKSFINLVTLLSSFPAVYELLAEQPLLSKASYSLRETPDSVTAVLDRLVMVDNDPKIHSLFNYEQSHVFGLRLLSMMTSCLDTFLLLQTQYEFQEMLLRCQAENIPQNSCEIIVDRLSVERNYVLVKTYLVGSSTERVLPARTIATEDNGLYPFPLFSSYPVPKEYIPSLANKPATKQDSDLSKYLSEAKEVDLTMAWLEKCRKIFCSLLTTKPQQAHGTVLQDLLQKTAKVIGQIPEDAIFPVTEYTASNKAIKKFRLSAVQELGIKLTIRYGSHLKLIPDTKDTVDKLTSLVKQCSHFLQQQQRAIDVPTLRCHGSSSIGYDWFVATVFLLMNGNKEKAWNLLRDISVTSVSAHLWLSRLHASVHLPASVTLSGILPVFSSACHNIELILQSDVSHVYSAFKMSGCSPAQICQHWIRQCFWNYLDWLDICQYVCVCLCLGVDYQVYTCVAILRHLHREIMHHMQHKNLIVYLKEEPIRGFRIGEHLEYMQQLECKFRKTVLPDLQNISQP
ncbi:hypothetical protein NP493_37g10001 [Ridgeia piscesae]|uniref:Protein broad-minded n=1 Tax=Ridgeia piscesae TaxID=27915 RepID=A0AAD9PCR7_RIDPI|nr:hypothetical protein NP493_37g10001 [Ridgeia piscesae]